MQILKITTFFNLLFLIKLLFPYSLQGDVYSTNILGAISAGFSIFSLRELLFSRFYSHHKYIHIGILGGTIIILLFIFFPIGHAYHEYTSPGGDKTVVIIYSGYWLDCSVDIKAYENIWIFRKRLVTTIPEGQGYKCGVCVELPQAHVQWNKNGTQIEWNAYDADKCVVKLS